MDEKTLDARVDAIVAAQKGSVTPRAIGAVRRLNALIKRFA